MGRGSQIQASEILYGDTPSRPSTTEAEPDSSEDALSIDGVLTQLELSGEGIIHLDVNDDNRCLANTIMAVHDTVVAGDDPEDWAKNIVRGGGFPSVEEGELAKKVGTVTGQADSALGGPLQYFLAETCYVKFKRRKTLKHLVQLRNVLLTLAEAGLEISRLELPQQR